MCVALCCALLCLLLLLLTACIPPTRLLPAAAFPCLVEADLAFTRVGDVGLLALARGSPRLRLLHLALRDAGGNLWSAGGWSSGGLAALARLAPQLTIQHTAC